jgi:hypothetical protein
MSCTCNIDLVPLGSPRCSFDFNIIRGAIFFDASVLDDTNNFTNSYILDIADLIDKGLAVASPKFFDVTTDKEAAVTQTFADGTAFYIRDGIRTFTGILAKPTPSQVGAFKALRCKKTAVYLVDNNGNILGYTTNTGTPNPGLDFLLPIPIEAGTVDAILAFATDAAIRQSNVTFQFSPNVSDEELRGATVSPDGFILDLIENPSVGVFMRNPLIGITNDQIDFALLYNNGAFDGGVLDDSDITGTTVVISGTNVTAGGNFSISANFASYSSPTFILDNLVPTNVTAGDEIVIKKITTLKAPFRQLLERTVTVTAL